MKKIRLEDIDKKTPFSVPDEFFSELTQNIQTRVSEKSKRQWVPVGQLKWALAGSLVLAVVFISILRTPSSQLSVEDLLAQVSEQDLVDYLDFNDVTDAELLEGLSDEEIDRLWSAEDNLEDLDLEGEDLEKLLMDYETDLDKYL
ncbi:MAG: hypothetical protein GY816_01345 [Cytophagales bacterium]|nr:hypothetical protein [Cytophagales bacterium]